MILATGDSFQVEMSQLIEMPRLAQTAILPFYARADDSGETHSILRDSAAGDARVQIERQFGKSEISVSFRVGCCVRNRIVDDWCRELAQEGITTVVDLGVGLNTRDRRLSDLDVRWIEIDHESIIGLRHQLWPDPPAAVRIPASMFNVSQWRQGLPAVRPERVLFLAEGVFCYWPARQVLDFVHELRRRFPQAWLAFDSLAPPLKWMTNTFRQRSREMRPRYLWATWNARTVFGRHWGAGVRYNAGFSECAGGVFYRQFPRRQRLFYSLPVVRRLYRLTLMQMPATAASGQ